MLCLIPYQLYPQQDNGLFQVEVRVDERVELFSTIFRLAGLPEYNQSEMKEYINDIELHFTSFKSHPVVEFARQLDTTIGMGYNAPMELAVHITGLERFQLRDADYPGQEYHDMRWDAKSIDKFLKHAYDFAHESNFMNFFNNHKTFYEFTENRLLKIMKKYQVREWLQSFYGNNSNSYLIVAIAMQNGGTNYGCQVFLTDGRHEVYAIPGVWMKDENGKPAFNQYTINRIVHEFSHSFVNPLVINSADKLETAGKIIYSHVEDDMERENYRYWKTMIYESVVRACEIRFNAVQADSAMTDQLIEEEVRYGFIWMKKLEGLLQKYENHRNTYPDFESFFPQIIMFFNNYATNIIAEIEELHETERKKWIFLEKDAPKIVSMHPVNGAKNVSPNLTEIQINFDRPMQKAYSLIQYGSSSHYPELNGDIYFDSTITKCFIPVKLKPQKHYMFGLNSDYSMDFRDKSNHPLVPIIIKFKTGTHY